MRVWRTICSYIWWTWDRGTLHYDIMVTLILLFIFVTSTQTFFSARNPLYINYKDKPVARELRPSEVQIIPDGSSGFVYWVEASAVQGGNEAEIRASLAGIVTRVAGSDAQVADYQAVREANGHVRAYKAWVRRGR